MEEKKNEEGKEGKYLVRKIFFFVEEKKNGEVKRGNFLEKVLTDLK